LLSPTPSTIALREAAFELCVLSQETLADADGLLGDLDCQFEATIDGRQAGIRDVAHGA
jgi:hypothetical protein